jgi:hypothetical protein
VAKSVLDGIPKLVAKATKGKFRKGLLVRMVPGGLDEYGDPADPVPAEFAFEGLREDYAADFRERAGIPQEDCRVLVFAATVTIEPAPDDFVYIESTWFKVRAIEEIDPARATFKLQCYKTTDPT